MAQFTRSTSVQSPEINPVIIAGSFNRTSGNVITKLEGERFTVARTSTGLYTITLADSYSALIYANANILATAAVNTFCQIDTESVTTSTGGTIAINTFEINESSGAADLLDFPHTTTDSTARLFFMLILRNSRL